MIHYFQKTLPHNAFFSQKGKKIEFDIVGPPRYATGFLAVDSEKDAAILADLQMAVSNGNVGGVREIDEATFEGLKKKLTNLPSPKESLPGPFGDQPLQVFRRNQDPFAKQGAAIKRDETPFQRIVREETAGSKPPLVETKPARARRPRTGRVEMPPQ